MSQRNQKRIFIGSLTVALVATTAIFFTLNQREAADQSTETSITIAAADEEQSALVLIAQNRGYFEDAGLNATLDPYPFGRLAVDALLAGQVDVAIAADFVLADLAVTHPELRVLGSVTEAENQRIVARRDHGIDGPMDARGRRIGVTRNTSGEFFLDEFLMSLGLTADDAEIVDLPPRDLVDALLEGRVDAVATWDPHAFTVEQNLGSNAVILSDSFVSPYYMLLLTTDSWVAANRDTAVRLLRALIMAEDHLVQDTQAVRSFLRERFNRDEIYAELIWQTIHPRIKLSQSLVVSLEDQYRWISSENLEFTEHNPNFLSMMSVGIMEEVRSDAVSIIH